MKLQISELQITIHKTRYSENLPHSVKFATYGATLSILINRIKEKTEIYPCLHAETTGSIFLGVEPDPCFGISNHYVPLGTQIPHSIDLKYLLFNRARPTFLKNQTQERSQNCRFILQEHFCNRLFSSPFPIFARLKFSEIVPF